LAEPLIRKLGFAAWFAGIVKVLHSLQAWYVYRDRSPRELSDSAIEMDEISLTFGVPPTSLETFVREQVASQQ
jgi:hypothetical protein